jgi:hypothetical protein
MDRIDEYRQIVERIVRQHQEAEPPDDQVEVIRICDSVGSHYLLMELGWQPPRRVYHVIFHLRLVEDKIHIEQDWTEYGVARELVEAGIPTEAVELMFQPPEMRPHIRLAP